MHWVCLTTECFKDMGIICQICNGDRRTPSSPKCQNAAQKAAHVAPKTINTDTTKELQSAMDHICLTTECFKGTGLVCDICNNNNISNNQDNIGASPAQVSSVKARSEDVAGSSTDAAATKETDFDTIHRTSMRCIDGSLAHREPASNQTLKENLDLSEALSATACQEGNKYVCPFCDMKFDEEYEANEHMIKKHGVTRIYKCPVEDCVSRFKSFRAFNRHLINPHKIDIYNDCATCPKCGKLFSTNRNMKRHYNLYHKLLYVSCTVCGLEVMKSKIDFHMVRHVPPENWYRCTYYGCKKQFPYIGGLNLHIKRSHERYKYYVHPCKNCNKMFDCASNAHTHYVACVGLTRFACDLCEKSHSTKGDLTKHKRAKHNETNLMFAN